MVIKTLTYPCRSRKTSLNPNSLKLNKGSKHYSECVKMQNQIQEMLSKMTKKAESIKTHKSIEVFEFLQENIRYVSKRLIDKLEIESLVTQN